MEYVGKCFAPDFLDKREETLACHGDKKKKC